jgi:ribosomal protein S12 methylthiotransferase
VLRTTFIVGFPGETEEHFEHLLAFVERHRFDHVGVFSFSAEEGTPAYSLPNQIPEALREQRRETLMLAQQPIAWAKNQGEIGKTVDVLIEQENPTTGVTIGRSARFAPEVDGLVYVTGSAPLNAIVPVTITAADTYDLFGEVSALA